MDIACYVVLHDSTFDDLAYCHIRPRFCSSHIHTNSLKLSFAVNLSYHSTCAKTSAYLVHWFVFGLLAVLTKRL